MQTKQIRTMHPDGFRSGQWADLTGAVADPETGRECWTVVFPDGTADFWVADDPDGQYGFRGAALCLLS